MNSERRLELLEAFASSKAAEFEGFKADWLMRYPEPVEPLTEQVVEAAQKPRRKRTSVVVDPAESE